jgi:hypothetical protein
MSRILCFSIVFAVIAAAQSGLRIISPTNGTIVRPGGTVGVDVAVSGPVLTAAAIAAEDPIKDSEVRTAPPYHFSITIPARIRPGLYYLTAEGASASSAVPSSERVAIDVERPDSPQRVWVPVWPRTLSAGGQSVVRIFGTYGNGENVDLGRSTQTTYETYPPGIVSVTKEGMVTGLDAGTTRVVVRHQDHEIDVKVVVKEAEGIQ